jgi:hypothetical protein
MKKELRVKTTTNNVDSGESSILLLSLLHLTCLELLPIPRFLLIPFSSLALAVSSSIFSINLFVPSRHVDRRLKGILAPTLLAFSSHAGPP